MNFGTLCFIFEGWNILLNNEFRMYGPRVIYYLIYKTDLNGNITQENPMDSVFPKNSDCNYSPKGNHNVRTSSSTHGYCVININSINDKVFVVFWFYNMIIRSERFSFAHETTYVKPFALELSPFSITFLFS